MLWLRICTLRVIFKEILSRTVFLGPLNLGVRRGHLFKKGYASSVPSAFPEHYG